MNRYRLLSGFVAILWLTQAFASGAQWRQPDTQWLYKTVNATELKLHVFTPEGYRPSDKRPAIIFFFGGG